MPDWERTPLGLHVPKGPPTITPTGPRVTGLPERPPAPPPNRAQRRAAARAAKRHRGRIQEGALSARKDPAPPAETRLVPLGDGR